MLSLIRYLKNNKAQSVIAPLFKLTEAIFELLVPLIMADIIDIGVANADSGYILKRAVVLVVLGVLGLACSLTAQYFAAVAAFGFGTELRKDLYRHICSLSFSEIDKCGTSTLINRMISDTALAQDGVNRFLRLFMRSPFIVVGALIMSLTISVKLTLIFVAAVPALSLVIYIIMRADLPRYKLIQQKLDGVMLSVRENLSGARVIRAFSAQEREKEQFYGKTQSLKKSQIEVGKIAALLNPLTYIIVYIAIIAIIWQGGISVNLGGIKQGQLIALISYMTQILFALIAFADLIIFVTKGNASAARISDLLSVRSSVEETAVTDITPIENAPAVCFENVSFAYSQTEEKSLSGISFSLNYGQTMGIIGGTGSGKSTLVNLIPRFYDAVDGSVKIDGVDVKEYQFLQLRKKIGIVPQKAVLFSGSVRSNMQWGNENATDEEIWQALETAQAKDFIEQKSGKLDEQVLQGGKNFSGGQKQRLTIARALAGSPEILILDDSASALDMATDAKLRRAISQTGKDRATVIVSQRASAVKNCDIIMVLDDGECVGLGTHDELMKFCDVYEEICLSQLSSEKRGGESA